jgi:hypothetical protein
MDCGKMATTSGGKTSIKVVTFSGKNKKDWPMWLGGEVPCQG